MNISNLIISIILIIFEFAHLDWISRAIITEEKNTIGIVESYSSPARTNLTYAMIRLNTGYLFNDLLENNCGRGQIGKNVAVKYEIKKTESFFWNYTRLEYKDSNICKK